MSLFTINVGSSTFYVTKTVTSTTCADIYQFDIFADGSDSIDITLTGSHENEYYILNGITTIFTDTVTVIFNTTLSLHFIIENSGNAGIFDECDVDVDNTTQTLNHSEIVLRNDDSNKCSSTISTAETIEIGLACSDETTILTAATSVVTFRAPYAITLTDVRATLTTAGTGAALVTIDINETGGSLLSTKLTIDATEKTSTTASTPAVITDASIADDAEITIDIDVIDTDNVATGLKVWLIGTRT